MHWSKIPEAGNALGIKLLVWIARIFGRWPFRIALFFVLLWFYPRRPLARAASLEYLSRLYQFSHGQTLPPKAINVFRHFFAFSENVLDKLLAAKTPKKTPIYVGSGREKVMELIEQKRGAMFITAHYGNLDLCRELFQTKNKIPITFFGYTEHAAGYNKMLQEMGHSIQMLDAARVGPETALILTERLERGGFIVIAADRVPITGDARTVAVDFLGRPAAFPVSPYWIAAALGCPIFSAFGRSENGRLHMTVNLIAEKIELPKKRSERLEAIKPHVRSFARGLEEQCVQAPLQWMNFYQFWQPKTDKNAKT